MNAARRPHTAAAPAGVPADAPAGFASHCCELLDAVGPCRARRMFGGHGIYADGVMIGLIADARLYLKVDEGTLAQWRAAGGEPFTYTGRGRPVQMSYWTPPESALESPALMAPWARLALMAALRSGAASRRARAQAQPAPAARGRPAGPARGSTRRG